MIRLLVHNLATHPAGCAVGPAVWPHFDLIYVHDGQIELRLMRRSDEEVRLSAGQAILLYPHTSFEGRCGAPKLARFSVQHFSIEAGGGVGVAPPFKDLLKRRRGFEIFDRRIAGPVEGDALRAIDLARREQTPLVHQMRLAMLTMILGSLRKAPPVLPGIAHGVALEPLIQWVQSRLDQGITIKDMARQMRLSPSHFRSLFVREVGQSAGKFLLNLRISEARRLLRETQIPIKQIATMVGYAGLVPFARGFKLHTGRTPAAYRRQL